MERAAGHRGAHRVVDLLRAHQHPSGEQAQTGVAGESVARPVEVLSGPPRVVVGEGHEVGVELTGAVGATRGPSVLGELEHPDPRVPFPHRRHRRVARAVVHDDQRDVRAGQGRRHPVEGREEPVAAVPA